MILLQLGLSVFLEQSVPEAAEAKTMTLAAKRSAFASMSLQDFATLSQDSLQEYLAVTQGEWGIQSLSGAEARTALSAPAVTSGLPSQAVLVRGFVQYLAERSRDELVVVYFDHLERHLREEPLSCLLPNAKEALSTFPTDGYRLALSRLSQAFAEDLDEMPKHLASADCLKAPTAEFWQWLRIGIDLYDGISSSQHPAHVMQRWAQQDRLPSQPATLRYSLAILGIIARDFGSAPAASLKKLEDPEERSLYIKKLVAELGVNFKVDSRALGEIAKRQDQVFMIFRALRDLDRTLQEAQKGVSGKPESMASALDEILQHVSGLMGQVQELLPQERQEGVAAALRGLDVALDLERALIKHEWVRAAERSLVALRGSGVKVDRRIAAAFDFGASLSSAKTPDEVSALIRSVAEPTGSYRSKRRDDENFAASTRFGLNAYVGGTGGAERRLSPSQEGKWVSSTGVTALVGVEMSHGLGSSVVSSVSICATALDFGNLLRIYSGGEDGLESADELRFQDVVAVGGFVMFGLGTNIPLSLGLGYQAAPKLRVDQSTGSRVDIERWSVVLGLDLPLLRF